MQGRASGSFSDSSSEGDIAERGSEGPRQRNMSVDVCELFNDLKSSEGLAGIVSKESSRLNHRFLPQAPGLDLSSNEGEKISKKSVGYRLQNWLRIASKV